MMTVGQLKIMLSEFSDDMRVLVDGYEGGMDDPSLVVAEVKQDPFAEAFGAWTGKYKTPEEGEQREFVAVLLSRKSQF